MLGWFRERAELKAARELGRRTAETVNSEIDAFMRERFYAVIPNIVGSVIGNLEDPNLPPMVAARADLKGFIENLDYHFRDRVVPQLYGALAEWLRVFANTDKTLFDDTECLIEYKYQQFKRSIAVAAYLHVIDRADDIKAKDDEWRAANPEKAALMPFDYAAAEITDVMRPYLAGPEAAGRAG
jgi:hypothetical protein